jgi:ribosome maturation factor RimP
MITEKQLTVLIEEHLKGSDKFLIEVTVKPSNHIMVFIDGDHGVSIENCQKLSRHIEQALDRDKEDFELMVSSAGADRPFRVPRQYLKHLGKTLEVVTVDGRKLEGILMLANDKEIKIAQEIKKTKKEIEKKEEVIQYSEIKSAKVVISFKKH